MDVSFRVCLQVFQQRSGVSRCGTQVVIQGRIVEEEAECIVLAVQLAGQQLYALQGRVNLLEGVGIIDIDKAKEPFFTTKPGDERSGMGFTVMESFMTNLNIIKNEKRGITVNMRKVFERQQVASI